MPELGQEIDKSLFADAITINNALRYQKVAAKAMQTTLNKTGTEPT